MLERTKSTLDVSTEVMALHNTDDSESESEEVEGERAYSDGWTMVMH
jgi:hypothetical protein